MIKAYIMKLEGKSRYAPTGKFHIRGEFIFDKPLTQKEITNFEKTIYISNEDLQAKIDKAIEMFDHETLKKYYYGMSYEFEINDFKEDILKILKGSDIDE